MYSGIQSFFYIGMVMPGAAPVASMGMGGMPMTSQAGMPGMQMGMQMAPNPMMQAAQQPMVRPGPYQVNSMHQQQANNITAAANYGNAIRVF